MLGPSAADARSPHPHMKDGATTGIKHILFGYYSCSMPTRINACKIEAIERWLFTTSYPEGEDPSNALHKFGERSHGDGTSTSERHLQTRTQAARSLASIGMIRNYANATQSHLENHQVETFRTSETPVGVLSLFMQPRHLASWYDFGVDNCLASRCEKQPQIWHPQYKPTWRHAWEMQL